jgi:hypothetical protein
MTATNFSIIVNADQTFVGPSGSLPAAGAGQTLVGLDSPQLAAFVALLKTTVRNAIVFNGTTFAVSPAETIRLALLAILQAQPAGVQTFFSAPAAEVKTLLQAGQIAAAREIIATVPLFGDTGLTTVQASMLAAFPN